MTKQEKDQANLEKNLKWVLKNFKKFKEMHPRPNYLMAIGISCQEGTMTYHYGSDPVAEEVSRLSKTVSEEDKKKKKVK